MRAQKTHEQTYVNLDRLDIQAVLDKLGVRVKGKTSGWYTAWCMFHADGDNPNLRINPNGGMFRCLSCGETGNILHITEKMLRTDREGAWAFLSNMEVHAPTAEAIKRKLDKRKFRAADKWIRDIEKRLDNLSKLAFTTSPGGQEQKRQAIKSKQVTQFFDLIDKNSYIVISILDHAMGVVYDDILPRMRQGDRDAYYEGVEMIDGVWESAEYFGYLVKHPFVWITNGTIPGRVTRIPIERYRNG